MVVSARSIVDEGSQDMRDEQLAEIAALVEAGKSLDPAAARTLVAEVYRLREAINGYPEVSIRPITPEGTDPSQAWFWTPEWQAGERNVDEEIAAGRVQTFDDVDALFAHLDREH
jgi:hypothetical protein